MASDTKMNPMTIYRYSVCAQLHLTLVHTVIRIQYSQVNTVATCTLSQLYLT